MVGYLHAFIEMTIAGGMVAFYFYFVYRVVMFIIDILDGPYRDW
jgi:hypothetical protein